MKRKPKILYVDDEEVNLYIFQCTFDYAFDILTAKNGIIALEILNKNPDIEAVVSDLKMPYMDGLEFIEKAMEGHSDVAYFMLSGFEINERGQEALNTQRIWKYFTKPIDEQEIVDSIREVLELDKV